MKDNHVDSPDLPHVVEQLERVDVVVVGKVHDTIETVSLDVLECSVPLVDASVLNVSGVLHADQMAIHDPRPPEDLGRLHGGGIHLHHDPEKGRRYEPQRLAQPVEVVGLEGAVVGRGDNDEELPEGPRIGLAGAFLLSGLELDSDEALRPHDLDLPGPRADEGSEIAAGEPTVVVEGEVMGTEAGVVKVGEGGEAQQESEDEEEEEAEEGAPPRGAVACLAGMSRKEGAHHQKAAERGWRRRRRRR